MPFAKPYKDRHRDNEAPPEQSVEATKPYVDKDKGDIGQVLGDGPEEYGGLPSGHRNPKEDAIQVIVDEVRQLRAEVIARADESDRRSDQVIFQLARLEDISRRLSLERSSVNQVDVPKEDLFAPPRTYAVRFRDTDRAKGVALLLYKGSGRGVGLRGGVLIVDEADFRLVDRSGLAYNGFEVNTNSAEQILERFGLSYRNRDKKKTI